MRSRLAAQSRILAARKNAAMTIRVFDPEGEVRANKVIGGHVGRLDSKITYDLVADTETAGQSGWITGMSDLVGDSEDEGAHMFERRVNCGHLVSRGGRKVVGVEQLF
jgi:hypothetical protein